MFNGYFAIFPSFWGYFKIVIMFGYIVVLGVIDKDSFGCLKVN